MLKYRDRPLDYLDLISEYQDIDFSVPPNSPKVKIALLADFATQQFTAILKTLLYQSSINAEIYEAPFDSIDLEIYNPGSGLYAFQPDIIVLLGAVQKLRVRYFQAASKIDFRDEEIRRARSLLETIRKNTQAVVLQSNYVLPLESLFGQLDAKMESSLYRIVQEVNVTLSNITREYNGLFLCDVDRLASASGRKNFLDDTLWCHSKSPCALDFLPFFAQLIVDLVVALKSRTVKCVVLDLDNTLWGGVIGDDGLEGIALGHLGEGEAYVEFQQYLLELKNRGIILAVCSKNDQEIAKTPFQSHPEMILKESDITVFIANWNNKADNIKSIREALNIGFDSMVFLDDNPYERNLVRQFLPEVIVPELPEDPACYVRAISELNLFETTTFTAEDAERAEMYRTELQRKNLQTSFTSIDDYLRSLEMKITVERFDSFNLPRIAQLVQRSNQFNLTTIRYTELECERIMKDSENHYPFYIKLRDKYGDYGLISVVILNILESRLEIDEWIMSCRVLSRGVEQYAMNHVFDFARRMNLKSVTGRFIPTAKNALVRDFYRSFGFNLAEEHADGSSTWTKAAADYEDLPVFIELEKDSDEPRRDQKSAAGSVRQNISQSED